MSFKGGFYVYVIRTTISCGSRKVCQGDPDIVSFLSSTYFTEGHVFHRRPYEPLSRSNWIQEVFMTPCAGSCIPSMTNATRYNS